MERACSSELLVYTYKSTRRCNTEDHQRKCREQLNKLDTDSIRILFLVDKMYFSMLSIHEKVVHGK